MRATILISFCLISMIVADQLYFKQQRQAYDGGSVSEAFLRKGTLGKLLKDNGLLSVSADSAKLAANDLCASDDEISGFDFHNTLRLRLRIHPKNIQQAQIKILMPDAIDKRLHEQVTELELQPGVFYYAIPFVGEIGSQFSVEIASDDAAQATVDAIVIDGRFARSVPLLEDGKLMDNLLFSRQAINNTSQANTQINNDSRFTLDQTTQRISFTLPDGMPSALFEGVFPGKKNHGYCSYQTSPRSYAQESDQRLILPKIDIEVLPEFLTGPDGLLLNKELKGRHSEVPAAVTVVNDKGVFQQAIGLRFHGGVPGRKKDIESFRIYARGDYGKSTLPASEFFSKSRDKGIKSLVLKYTFQVFGDEVHEFNVFAHAFALAVGERIGALVPSHNLVDLSINGEPYGMYLAMEHISDRGIENWLGHDDFAQVTYKKENTLEARIQIAGDVMGAILNIQGEAAYDKLQQFYDVDNVINSVILTAYIGDDDYCQGTEIYDHKTDSLVSLNWDLDHAFLRRSASEREYVFGNEELGFQMLRTEKAYFCPRTKVYSWVYSQSARFRQALRERFDELVENQLSPETLSTVLDRYSAINEHHFAGSQTKVIQQMRDYTSRHPATLQGVLEGLEARYSQN